MSSNVVDGLLEVLSDEGLGLDHIILIDENGTHYRIQNLNIKDVFRQNYVEGVLAIFYVLLPLTTSLNISINLIDA